MYSKSVLNSCYVYDKIETSKEILAGSLKTMLTYPEQQAHPPVLLFWIKVTPHCHILHTFVRKTLLGFFKKTLFDDILQYSS